MVCMIDYVSFRIIVPHINIFYSFNDIMQLIPQKYVNFDFFQISQLPIYFFDDKKSNVKFTNFIVHDENLNNLGSYMKNEHSQLLITWSMHTEKSAVHATYS